MPIFNESVLVEMERKARSGEYVAAAADGARKSTRMRIPTNRYMDVQAREVKEKESMAKEKKQKMVEHLVLPKVDEDCLSYDSDDEVVGKKTHDDRQNHLFRQLCPKMTKDMRRTERYENAEIKKKKRFIADDDDESEDEEERRDNG